MLLILVVPAVIQSQTVEIKGALKISESAGSPDTGMIRWTNEDFEGYDGTQWRSLTGTSQSGSIDTGEVKDVDGNVYRTIVIDSVEWMVENLRTTTLSNGSNIPHAANMSVWKQLDKTQAYAYCWYDNDKPNHAYPYGATYNWYTVETGDLCPSGWHVPSDAEWTSLTDSLGGLSAAGAELKAAGDISAGDGLWSSPNTGATNSSGFTAYPGGARFMDGQYYEMNNAGFWWTGTPSTDSSAVWRFLSADNTAVNADPMDKRLGLSVRCVKD